MVPPVPGRTLARRIGPRLRPDPTRVITRLCVPGEELPESLSRADGVIDRVLELDDGAIDTAVAEVKAHFADRHRDLPAVLAEHFRVAAQGRPELRDLSDKRRMLIGAYFTSEYSVESAALFNPSMVEHPDQRGLQPDQLRFVMSVRSLGEGHVSSVGFRTGVIGPGSTLCVDPPGPLVVAGAKRPATHHREVLRSQLAELKADSGTAAHILGVLPEEFDAELLRRAVSGLHPHLSARAAGRRALEHINRFMGAGYEVALPPDTAVGERLLWPGSPQESHGMEDVRLVRFVDEAGGVEYQGTYTAYDGSHVTPKKLSTTDFATFRISPLAGPAARNKGLALFPRKVGGRYMALARWDRETTSLGTSDDGRVWQRAGSVQSPATEWDLVQTGNCGSPIETEAGWLVLTHGVGPMRTYTIGALLLDLDDPTRQLATLTEPLLWANDEERDGYVPNVVYSCGALRYGEKLIIPYGISDSAIGFAEADLPRLIERMCRTA